MDLRRLHARHRPGDVVELARLPRLARVGEPLGIAVGPTDERDDHLAAVEADIRTFKTATAGVPTEETFMTSPSPGQIGRFLHNQYYPNDEAYLFALADVMKAQYEAIVKAGIPFLYSIPVFG